MNLDLLVPYVEWLVVFIIALIVLYIRTLVTEKAKNRVLRKRNAQLTEETESIKSKYTQEIEVIKKEHQLDIEKRKFQYESKKEQYVQFFRLLDDFSFKANEETHEKFLPILDEFNRNYLSASSRNNVKAQTMATTVFSKKCQKLMFDANKELMRIKQETNTIRLVASDELLETLSLLELAYERSMDESTIMMNELSIQVIANDQNGISRSQARLKAIGQLILKHKNELIEHMRKELDEI